jgi:hypothetical protein
MTVVQLTAQGAPSYPIKVNSEHVASLRPLRKVKPTMNTQTPGAVHTVFEGTEILLSSGQKHNVLEDYAEVDNALFGLEEVTTTYPNEPWISDSEEFKEVSEGFARALRADGLANHEKIATLDLKDHEAEDKFIDDLKEAGVPITNDQTLLVEEPDTETPPEGIQDTNPENYIDGEVPDPIIERPLSAAEKRKRTLDAKKKAAEETPDGGSDEQA